jgi:hypothetical protein
MELAALLTYYTPADRALLTELAHGQLGPALGDGTVSTH